MVLGVCRRLLYDPQEVEDAFQATFLVLVRGRDRSAVAAWLATGFTASPTGPPSSSAQSARRRYARRPWTTSRRRQPCPLHRQEMCSLIDQEVHRLPDKYRVPFVLCHRGRTNGQAAVELGLPKGTVATRIARARARLRSRLVGRGVALSFLTFLLPDALRAAVPPSCPARRWRPGLRPWPGRPSPLLRPRPSRP
jgi:DNA-directed RNA polymerase specialized sigma24 family protein